MSEDQKCVYAVNEMPPPVHLLVSSIQHLFLMITSLSLPILFAAQISGSPEFAASLIAFSMWAAGIGSILQALKLPYVGSGYLCPNLCGPSYFSLSLSAAWVGGMPLVRGMTIIAGLIEMAIAPIIKRLRRVFPTFIVGLVMAMVGVSIITPGITSFFGLALRDDAIRTSDIIIGALSLMTMVLANLWGKGNVRIYCLIIGIATGWIAAFIFLPGYRTTLSVIHQFPVFSFPRIGPEFRQITFDPKLILPFAVIAIGGSLKSFGNLLVAQKIFVPTLKEPDYVPLRNGLMADGISTVLAGIFGGMAVDTSSSNVGLAAATKVFSRWICVGAGVLFITLAFFPRFVILLAQMPMPVLGASIIFAGCFMLCIGLQEMFSEEWNPHKTFVVGIALIFGLSTAFLPGLYARAPHVIQTFFTDPLPTTAIIAIGLNQFLQLGTLFRKKAQ